LHLRLDAALVGPAKLLLDAEEGELHCLLIVAGACCCLAASCRRSDAPLRQRTQPIVREGLEDAEQSRGGFLALELAQGHLAVRTQGRAYAARAKRVLWRGEGARGARLRLSEWAR
jgi:hypothetical protein